jgi:hypothetical protein
MASNAVSSMGTKFWRWDGSSTWEAIAEISAIDGPTMTREMIDVTALDSEGGYREYVPDLRDGGTVSLTMNFTDDTFEIMMDDFESNDRQWYAIVLPTMDHTSLEFQGLVTEVPLSASVGSQVTANTTIRVTGQPIRGYADSTGSPTGSPED